MLQLRKHKTTMGESVRREEKELTHVLEMGLITERTRQETQESSHRDGRSSGVMETGMFEVLF